MRNEKATTKGVYCPSLLYGGVGEEQIQIAQERAGVADEDGAKRQNGSDEAVVDQTVNSAVLDHGPGILRSWDVRLAVKRNVAEGVAVEEAHSPFEDRDKATQNTEQNVPDDASNTALRASLTTRD